MNAPMVEMAKGHYRRYVWVQAPIAALALWLMSTPLVLDYADRAMSISDVVSGAIALLMAILARKPNRGLVSWLIAFVGLWLLLAPLVFWAPRPVAALNDTLVGSLLIVFSLLIPMGMQMEGPAIPPGWSYNPSAWSQRAPVIALGFIGFCIARYMASYQLGYTSRVVDPFFGDGSVRVLTSKVSRAWPVSDAGLGAVTYLLEVLMGFMGDQRRWRTMPWMVAGFGFVVIPLGIVSIVLVILQPVVVGAWCSPCLATAVAMLFMIPLSIDEIVAMAQFVARERREGRSAWRAFWLGGHLSGDAQVHEPVRPETYRPRGMLWGVTSHWALWLSAAIGVWLMCAPSVLGIGMSVPAADSSHLAGALIVVVAVIALAEVARAVRYLNVLIGLWLVLSPWFVPGNTDLSAWSGALFGAWLILLSLPLGKLRDHYGRFDSVAVWSPSKAARERNRKVAWQTQPAAK